MKIEISIPASSQIIQPSTQVPQTLPWQSSFERAIQRMPEFKLGLGKTKSVFVLIKKVLMPIPDSSPKRIQLPIIAMSTIDTNGFMGFDTHLLGTN